MGSFDKLAEKLARWFGSAPFIAFHFVWFSLWVALHFLIDFDPDWSTLTLIVSLEAIFLSLFILRAENVEADRTTDKIKNDIRKDKEQIKLLKSLQRKDIKK